MTTPIAQNPAVTNPHRNLTALERDALLSIDFYRHQRAAGRHFLIGPKRFAKNVVLSIEQKGLIRKSPRGFAPTMGGDVAIAKLKRPAHEHP